jgi:hypothetical protein
MAVPVVITDYHPDQILTAGELNFDFARAIDISAVGLAGGVAPLGLDGKVPTTMLPPAATGLSITSTAINGSGHLIITYSNAPPKMRVLSSGRRGPLQQPTLSVHCLPPLRFLIPIWCRSCSRRRPAAPQWSR